MKIPRNYHVQYLRILGFVLSAALVISCKSKPDLKAHIPSDAGVVVTIDVKSLALKSLDFKEIFSLSNLKKVAGTLTESEDSSKVSFGDPGFDFTSNLYVFGGASEESKYGALAASLSDAGKFEAFIKKSDSSLTISEEGGLKLVKFGEQGIVGWDKDVVFAVFGNDKAKEKLISIANLKKEESLDVTNKSFNQSQKEGGDISLWLNYGHITKVMPQYGAALGTLNLRDTYLTAATNFEDGQIAVNMKYATNSEMAQKYNFIKSGVNGDVVGILPGKSLIGVLSVGLDMNKVYNQLDQANLVNAYGQAAYQFTGMTIKEVITMLSGDIAIAVNGIEMKEVPGFDYQGQPVMRKQPSPDYSVVLGIADKEKLAKLLEQLTKAGMLTKSGKHYSFQDKVFVLEKGPALVIAGTSARVKSLEDASDDKLDAGLASLLTSSASSLYFNLANIPDQVYGDPATAEKVKRTELESIEVNSSAIKDSTSTGKLLIKFRNKKENALVTIVRVSKSFAKDFKSPASPFSSPAQLQPDSTVVQ